MEKLIVNIETNEEQTIVLSELEIEEFNSNLEKTNLRISEQQTAEAAKAAEKQQILAQLGITEEQAKLLLS